MQFVCYQLILQRTDYHSFFRNIMSIFIIHHYFVRRIPYHSLLPSGLLPIVLNGILVILPQAASNFSNLANPIHIYSNAGTYNVELYIRHNDLRTDTTWQTITILSSPNVNLGSNRTICIGDSTTFNAGVIQRMYLPVEEPWHRVNCRNKSNL